GGAAAALANRASGGWGQGAAGLPRLRPSSAGHQLAARSVGTGSVATLQPARREREYHTGTQRVLRFAAALVEEILRDGSGPEFGRAQLQSVRIVPAPFRMDAKSHCRDATLFDLHHGRGH